MPIVVHMKSLKLITLLLAVFALVNCGSSELGKKAAGELCTCLSGFNPDSEEIEELSKGMDCLTNMMGNEAYANLGESDVMGAMGEQCPAEKAKFEKLTSEE
jgi:hypothetical protein